MNERLQKLTEKNKAKKEAKKKSKSKPKEKSKKKPKSNLKKKCKKETVDRKIYKTPLVVPKKIKKESKPVKRSKNYKRLYSIWQCMKSRCYYKNGDAYINYGGRGITVCDEWSENFNCFMEWAEANGYDKKLTIDRIDNDGNYCPENCHWATYKEQSNNRSSNHNITIDGVTKNITQWSETTGVKTETIRDRIKRGWDEKRAITTPPLQNYTHLQSLKKKKKPKIDNKLKRQQEKDYIEFMIDHYYDDFDFSSLEVDPDRILLPGEEKIFYKNLREKFKLQWREEQNRK